jgi:hypothetical protein
MPDDPDQSADGPLDRLSSGTTVTVPVTTDGDDLVVLADRDDRIHVVALGADDPSPDDGPCLLTGDLSTYAEGVGTDRSYLVLDGVDGATPAGAAEAATPPDGSGQGDAAAGTTPFPTPERLRAAGSPHDT